MDGPLDATLRALGLTPLDRLRCHAGTGLSMSEILKADLSLTKDPHSALVVLMQVLIEALEAEDGEVVQVILDQAEHFGIGILSLWLAAPEERKQVLNELWPSCLKGIPVGPSTSLEHVSRVLGSVPGPLVLNGWRKAVSEGLGPNRIEGPLRVKGSLSLEDCTELESLPDLMVVEKDLEICRCPALRRFPKRLEVGGNLTVHDLPRLERSLCRATIGGQVKVRRSPALRLVPEGSWEPE